LLQGKFKCILYLCCYCKEFFCMKDDTK
jgi:hypothetical protein